MLLQNAILVFQVFRKIFYSYKGASYSLEYLSALSGTDGVITSLDKTKTQLSEGDIVAVLADVAAVGVAEHNN